MAKYKKTSKSEKSKTGSTLQKMKSQISHKGDEKRSNFVHSSKNEE